MTLDLTRDTHRRYDLLSGEWIQVAPHRIRRPWEGRREPSPADRGPRYDPECYLCPGNERAGGAVNPSYDGTFVFTNDFSALQTDGPGGALELGAGGLLRARGVRGTCRVVCFSPRHDLTLAEMSAAELRAVVDCWVREYRSLGERPGIDYVQIFENKGEMMGCSNPHPHGQIYAQETIPGAPSRELRRMREHHGIWGRTLLTDYLELELGRGERIVDGNEHFVALVPFWAYWPFETLIVPRRPFGRFDEMTDGERSGLAAVLRAITIRYDNLFRIPFPYSAGFHPAPTDGREHPEWHFHMHFYPPLLRSATVRKFQAGYEMLATPQRDVTPEACAARLRDQPEVRFGEGEGG